MNFFDGLFFGKTGSVPEYVCFHRHEPCYYGIQFNYRGALRLKIGSRREHTAEGCYAFLTYPGEIFQYGSVDGKPRHHNFVCTYGPKIEQYLASGLFERNPDDPLVLIPDGDRFLEVMNSLRALCSGPGRPPPRAVLLFEDLLLQIQEAKQLCCQEKGGNQFNALLNAIRTAPERSWDFGAEARKREITATHFRRLFKAETGTSPLQFVIRCRLRKAAELLLASGKSVKEISDLAGFDSVFYFSKLFRKKYQISPSRYRNEFTGKVTDQI